MDGRRDLFERIRYRVYNRFAEGKSVFRYKRLIPVSGESGFTPTIKTRSLLGRLDTYDRPHAMVVRIQIHAGSPSTLRIVSCSER